MIRRLQNDRKHFSIHRIAPGNRRGDLQLHWTPQDGGVHLDVQQRITVVDVRRDVSWLVGGRHRTHTHNNYVYGILRDIGIAVEKLLWEEGGEG